MPWTRFIPAYAGSTTDELGDDLPKRVHPRIRGVHRFRDRQVQRSLGSSPHMRGPRPDTVLSPPAFRFIPAYAGSTPTCQPTPCRCRVHPRIRGVHASQSGKLSMVLGSSPHTRGPPMLCFSFFVEYRFIPAYAGSTTVWEFIRVHVQVHPRIRGVHRCRTAGL